MSVIFIYKSVYYYKKMIETFSSLSYSLEIYNAVISTYVMYYKQRGN